MLSWQNKDGMVYSFLIVAAVPHPLIVGGPRLDGVHGGETTRWNVVSTRDGRRRIKGASFLCVPDNVGCTLMGRQHGLNVSERVLVFAGVVYRLPQGKTGSGENGEEQQHVDRNHNVTESGAAVFSHAVNLHQQRQKIIQKDHHTALWLVRQKRKWCVMRVRYGAISQ